MKFLIVLFVLGLLVSLINCQDDDKSKREGEGEGMGGSEIEKDIDFSTKKGTQVSNTELAKELKETFTNYVKCIGLIGMDDGSKLTCQFLTKWGSKNRDKVESCTYYGCKDFDCSLQCIKQTVGIKDQDIALVSAFESKLYSCLIPVVNNLKVSMSQCQITHLFGSELKKCQETTNQVNEKDYEGCLFTSYGVDKKALEDNTSCILNCKSETSLKAFFNCETQCEKKLIDLVNTQSTIIPTISATKQVEVTSISFLSKNSASLALFNKPLPFYYIFALIFIILFFS
ncbi:hypothetical protein K502DRAFT_346235 [Neoconidiobolus thromboides FSU 785]|nr:hypothetical protein K502DRAFT_346235 [Neoconidiobolus thromboides FSU 785]